jgi:copper chaperone CopZ
MRFSLILSTLLLFLSTSCFFSQTTSFDLGIDGLTCSQCSKSVEKQLKKLDFVKEVDMQLATTRAIIQANETSIVSPDAISKAVINAGFSVRYLKLRFSSLELKPCMVFEGLDGAVSIINSNEISSEGNANTIRFLGRAFQSKKEFKGTKIQLNNQCSEIRGKVYFTMLESTN